MSTMVAINPKAGGGLAGRIWPELSQRLKHRAGAHEAVFADGPGDLIGKVADAVAAGTRRIVVVGGDGTVNEAVNGLAGPQGTIPADAELGVVPVGTGCDFARTYGIPSNPLHAVDRIAGGAHRFIDIGRVTFLSDDGQKGSRLFANIASFGLSGAVDREVNAAGLSKALPGTVSYYMATVRGLLGYRFQKVRLTLDDLPPLEAEIAMTAVANGRFFGGGMMVAPDAEPDDGLFDVVLLRGTSKWVLLRDLRLVYNGLHRDHPSISIARARRVVAEPVAGDGGGPVLLDIDGESPGRLPAAFDIVSRALKVLC